MRHVHNWFNIQQPDEGGFACIQVGLSQSCLHIALLFVRVLESCKFTCKYLVGLAESMNAADVNGALSQQAAHVNTN